MKSSTGLGQFLYSMGCYRKFLYNAEQVGTDIDFESKDPDIFEKAFNWSDTLQGNEYWKRIAMDWRNKLTTDELLSKHLVQKTSYKTELPGFIRINERVIKHSQIAGFALYTSTAITTPNGYARSINLDIQLENGSNTTITIGFLLPINPKSSIVPEIWFKMIYTLFNTEQHKQL